VSQLHRTEARARDERKLTGWLGSRRRATRAERRLSRAIVANDVAEHEIGPLLDLVDADAWYEALVWRYA